MRVDARPSSVKPSTTILRLHQNAYTRHAHPLTSGSAPWRRSVRPRRPPPSPPPPRRPPPTPRASTRSPRTSPGPPAGLRVVPYERMSGWKTAFTTRTRSYGDQCIERTEVTQRVVRLHPRVIAEVPRDDGRDRGRVHPFRAIPRIRRGAARNRHGAPRAKVSNRRASSETSTIRSAAGSIPAFIAAVPRAPPAAHDRDRVALLAAALEHERLHVARARERHRSSRAIDRSRRVAAAVATTALRELLLFRVSSLRLRVHEPVVDVRLERVSAQRAQRRLGRVSAQRVFSALERLASSRRGSGEIRRRRWRPRDPVRAHDEHGLVRVDAGERPRVGRFRAEQRVRAEAVPDADAGASKVEICDDRARVLRELFPSIRILRARRRRRRARAPVTAEVERDDAHVEGEVSRARHRVDDRVEDAAVEPVRVREEERDEVARLRRRLLRRLGRRRRRAVRRARHDAVVVDREHDAVRARDAHCAHV
eukprot:30856-Pelagococcus_subviridis.AAC.2